MNKKHTLSLFIFRRDLRLDDNSALLAALESSKLVIPCFIFDPEQCSSKNPYFSANAVQFMVKSLQELEALMSAKNGRLYSFFGNTEKVVAQLLEWLPIQAIFLNRDYTPFSRQRDKNLAELSAEKNRDFYYFDDYLLHPPEEVIKADSSPYTVFTPYYKKSLDYVIQPPLINHHPNYYTQEISLPQIDISREMTAKGKLVTHINPAIKVSGGRKEGLKHLKQTIDLKEYQKTRDFPAEQTSLLSAHHKFGTISIRESYQGIADILGRSHPLLRQLYWRDFFTQIAYYFPHVFGESFHKEYDQIDWGYSPEKFQRWAAGVTGFPIVDAGMRELNTTGYMHNRVRMIVASFLVKDLHLDWRLGEQYFAQKLIDYDPSVNNGNWQWSASTGCDAQPYFRIFNPWLQQKKFDPECFYIRKWVPELQTWSAQMIHQWENKSQRESSYPRPMLNHQEESKKSLLLFKKARKGTL
jgi:deoxyribodipyrimidine photo-lyase